MKVHWIELPKIGFLTRLISALRGLPTRGGTSFQIQPNDHSFTPTNPVYRGARSPFDVRYGNTIVLQIRHDYIR